MEVVVIPVKKKENIRLKVAAYARVSTDSDNLLHSLENQISYYTKYIQANPEWDFVGMYADEGITGTSIDKREEFLRMMDDARDGKINLILTKSVSRFARDTVDFLNAVRELRSLGVEIRFEKENISNMGLEGELIITLMAAFAQAESESISNNVKWAHSKKIEKGIPATPVDVFGYRWNKDMLQYEPYEDEAIWVRYMYDRCIDGISLQGLTNDLRLKGVKGVRGKPIPRTTVRRILTSDFYLGNLLLQKNIATGARKHKPNDGELPMYRIEGAHEPIISVADYQKVQEILIKNQTESPNYGYKKSEFAGRLKCGKCGSAVTRITYKGNPETARYECRCRKSGECDLLPIRETEIRALMDNNDTAVIYDGIIELYIDGKLSETITRNIPFEKALSGRIKCSCCGSRFNRESLRGEYIWACKNRMHDRNSCEIKLIRETELYEALNWALMNPENLGTAVYCNVRKISIGKNLIIIELKEGVVKLWKRS